MPEPFNNILKSTPLPDELGPIADIAPVNHASQSVWLVLAVDGGIFRFNAETRELTPLARSSVPTETVPKPFAFADAGNSVVAIHRTDWNRLDFSDPATGKLLSERGPTSYREDEEQPEHYLDYFHGALYVNPASTRIADDGWIDGTSLFSSSETGLARWSIEDGVMTGQLEGFQPRHHHRGARELAQLVDGVLVRWRM